MLEIDKLIMEATKAKQEVRKTVLRNLKSKIQAYKTSKGAKEYTDAVEISIIKKMNDELLESVGFAKMTKHEDLVQEGLDQLSVLNEFLPAEPTADEIKNVLAEFGQVDKTKMGAAIKFIKSKLPTANGKTVSDIVKEAIEQQ